MRNLWPAAVLLMLGCSTVTVRPDSITLLTPDGAAALLRERPQTYVLDVSPPDDFAAAHLAGAVNIPRSQLWTRLDELPPDQGTVILVCDAQGQRSRSAAILLRDEGYYRVHELRGGTAGWTAAGYGLNAAF